MSPSGRMLYSMILPLVLAVASALAFDHTHAAYQQVLSGFVRSGNVNYAGLKANPVALDTYLAAVAAADATGMSAAQKKAFYINVYNALTLDLIADSYPLASILDLDGGKVWDTRRFRVAGQERTLNYIEHQILRPLGDPRIHAALNCASKGCPPLSATVFLADTLDAQLDAVARAWAASTVIAGGTVTISRIFDWFGEDFLPTYGSARRDIPNLDGKAEAAINFIASYSSDKATFLNAGGYTVVYADYDWRLNQQ